MTGSPEPRPSPRPPANPAADPRRIDPARAPHLAPAPKPSGSMIYTVQKGANIIPSWRKA